MVKTLVVSALASLLLAGWGLASHHEAGSAETHPSEDISNAASSGGTGHAEPARASADAAELAASAIVSRVQPDGDLDNLFANYGNSGQGWTGGDGGASARLPDGRIFWAFSDTWLGPVLPNGLRPQNLPLLSNVAVIQSRNRFTTLYGGTPSSPKPFLTSGLQGDTGYWNNGAIVSANTLYVSYSAYSALEPGFSYQLLDTVFAAYSLPNLSLESVTPVDQGSQMKWGVCMLRQGGYVYIYGAGFAGSLYGQTDMYVARAPESHVLGPWQYFNGRTWSDNSSDAAPLTNIVRDPYSVGELDGIYVLFTMPDAPLSTELQAYFGPTPVGPFTHGESIYSTVLPEESHYVNPNSIYEYGAYLHPEFTKGNTLVVSYQVNSFTSQGWVLAKLIRPRYIDVTISFDEHNGNHTRRDRLTTR
jgi:hypothetical protein